MVDITPFKAIRYNDDKFGTLSTVVCPPYDVISVPEYHRLLARHPQNMVRIELPLAQGKEDRYDLAATLWKRWQTQRILVEDKESAFYGYEQRFIVNGKAQVRSGFFAALRVEKPGEGHVRPHERTFPKHKEDRLRLMRATHASISPIFGIFFDRQKKAQKWIAELMTEKPLLISRDDKGVTHRLWKWTDEKTVQLLQSVLKAEDVLIADGHHRYETAWNYADERSKQDRSKKKNNRSYRYVMTFLCPLADPGLIIQPTHRSIRLPEGAVQGDAWEYWRPRVEKDFTAQKMTSFTQMLAKIRAGEDPSALGLILQGGKLFWLKPKSANATMPVVPLHETILKDIPLENISYGQNPKEMVEMLQRGEASAVVLLPAPDKATFAKICKAGKRLPQKSTYFYPKLATGFVMRSLDGDL